MENINKQKNLEIILNVVLSLMTNEQIEELNEILKQMKDEENREIPKQVSKFYVG